MFGYFYTRHHGHQLIWACTREAWFTRKVKEDRRSSTSPLTVSFIFRPMFYDGWCGNPNSSTVRSEQFWSSDRSLHVWRLEVLRNLVCSLECHCPPAGGSWILDAAPPPCQSPATFPAPRRHALPTPKAVRWLHRLGCAAESTNGNEQPTTSV